MAVIYSYPVKSTPELTDKMLISDGTDNLTKQVTISGVKDTIDVVDSITATSPLVASTSTGAITLSIPAATSGVDGYLTSTNWSTFNGKQPELQSGVNIKTINSNSILGSGDLVISGGAANPAGANTQVQFNSSGSFGASTNLTFSTDRLTLTDTLEIKGDGVNPGTLKLYCEDTTTPHAVSILGPIHSGATPYSIRLPKEIATQAAYSSNGRILESDASGALQWITTPTGGSGSYSAGDGLDLNGTVFSAGRLTNGGLTINGGKLQVKLNDTAMSGTLRAVDGGTGVSTYTIGDLLYAETASTLAALNTSSGNKYLGTATASPYTPQWKTSLVPEEINTGNLLIGGATSTSEMTLLDTTTKGTIAVGNGSTTTTLAVGTDNYYLKARSSTSEGMEWAAITYPTVSLTSGVSGILPVANGGTGLTSVSANGIVRGNGTSALAADTNFTYNGLTGALTLAGQLVATANAGTNTAVRGIASNSSSTQGWSTNLGVANFDQNDTGVYSTTIAVNTESSNGKLISFYYQKNSGTGPKGEIKYDTTSSQVQYNVTSDYRLKENIVDLTSAVDRVKNLKPKRFNFIGNASEIDGFLAHEVQEVVPQAVSGIKDQIFEDGQVNPQQMDASKLVPVLTAAIKELTARIEALEA